MVYAEFGGQTECIMGNWKIENLAHKKSLSYCKTQYGHTGSPLNAYLCTCYDSGIPQGQCTKALVIVCFFCCVFVSLQETRPQT